MSNIEKLRKSFSDALEIDLNQVTENLQYQSIPEWDSIAHMILISEIESNFDITIGTEDVIDLSSVKEAKRILMKYDISF